MSYTMTLDMPQKATEYVERRGARFRDQLNAIVLAIITTQMEQETADGCPRNAQPNGDAVFAALCDCPVDVDFNQLIPKRSGSGRLHPVDFDALLREDA